MRIKSLQVHGFKSFVDRTVFSFERGVTAVVGPNGCGKSNVVDAVRWVMGEQSPRRLRGKGMEDVIFAGSENRPPIGMAEVVLTFDNADGQAPAEFASYPEIQITRRLYRSGESEYLLNRTPARLRDVHDFFRDTGIGTKGYTIVEQGRIAEIVSAKPEDRRVLIEEAAGISKYKARRREAESKIASTEQNLVRVNDVLGEIRRQIASLERQARKAARYKRLRETLRVLELSLAADERSELRSAVESATARLQELRDKATALDAQASQRDLAVQEKRILLAESEKAVTQGAERLYGLRSEIKGLEGQIELGRRECETLAESNTGRRDEIEQLREQLENATRERQELGDELHRLEGALAGEAEAISAAEAEARRASQALRELERERDTANETFVGVLTEIARSEDRAAALADRSEEIDQRMRSTDRRLEVNQNEAIQAAGAQRDLEQGLRNLLSERDALQAQLLKAMKNHERQVERAREASEALREMRERYESRKARFDSLREVVERREDVSAGTRHLLECGDEARDRFGVRGLVREVLEFDREAEAAVEAVLAERAEALVVERADGAVAALAELREREAGHGLFVVAPPSEAVSPGTVPLGEPLLGRVRARSGFEGIARALLADVYLVGSLDEALAIYGAGRLPATFVTREGDLLSPDGLVRGGRATGASGALTRVREVRELDDEVAAIGRDVELGQAAHREADAALVRANEELDNLRNRHHTAALAVANHEKDLERSSERVKALGEAQEGRVEERSGLMNESEVLSEELQRLTGRLEERRGERATRQRELDALGLRISSAGRDVTRLENRLTELRVERQGRVENRDRLSESVGRSATAASETSEWIARREREIEGANERRDALQEQERAAGETLATRLEEEEQARLSSEQQREAYEREAGGLRVIEDEVRAFRSQLSAAREEAGGAELTARESELRLRHLDEQTREKWDIDLAHWVPPRIEDLGAEAPPLRGSPESESDGSAPESDESQPSEEDNEDEEIDATSALREARRNAQLAAEPRELRELELERSRKSMQSLGDVNLGAIEEHEELAERFRFLSEQKEDLELTIESLREAISRINRTSRKRFRETFEAVSKCFSENFPRMFGGGKGKLMLTDAEDILEAGVDIMAMPPGKRLQNVNLLSGGEKTMTAIALLVAVFQVRPSPFFLLDEVDAALDDANVGRFNELIREMATQSQFLVITHNKRTIEVADVLYGVTMEQRGVSKLVSVELR